MGGTTLWKMQRLTALINLITIVYLIYLSGCLGTMTYLEWVKGFSPLPVRLVLTFSLFSFIKHASIGTWTILTDYVKSTLLREVLGVFFLILFLITALLILTALWSLA